MGEIQMASEKIEALAARILQECEQESFTISEAFELVYVLRNAIEGRVVEMHKEIRISTGAQVRKGPDIVAGQDLPFPQFTPER